jgi:hypothetical protein
MTSSRSPLRTSTSPARRARAPRLTPTRVPPGAGQAGRVPPPALEAGAHSHRMRPLRPPGPPPARPRCRPGWAGRIWRRTRAQSGCAGRAAAPPARRTQLAPLGGRPTAGRTWPACARARARPASRSGTQADAGTQAEVTWRLRARVTMSSHSAIGHACMRRRPAAAAGLGHRPAGRDLATRGGRAPGRACASRGSPALNVRPASCGRPSSTKGDAGLAALPRRTPCSMSFAGARAPGSVTDPFTRRAREDGRRRPGLACRRYRVV